MEFLKKKVQGFMDCVSILLLTLVVIIGCVGTYLLCGCAFTFIFNIVIYTFHINFVFSYFQGIVVFSALCIIFYTYKKIKGGKTSDKTVQDIRKN